MRKTASRIAALLLAAMTLQLFACGNDAGTTNTGNDTSSGDTETTAPETEKPFADNLGEYDFGGADFTMLVRETRNNLICPESETGDVVNDSIYKRNEKISDRFNVNIKSVTLPDESTQWNQQLEGEVMSGSGDYDVVMPDYWWGCETHGLFLNLLDYDVFDFSAPYGTTARQSMVSFTARSAQCRSTSSECSRSYTSTRRSSTRSGSRTRMTS